MAELYAMKEKLLLAGIVVCPTLEELYAALNSAKARLLGPTSLRIAMPQGRRSTVAGRAKKASPTTRKMQRRRSEAPDTYRLTVNVLSAKLREGSSRVYAWDASLTSARLTHARSPAALSPHSPSPLQLRARQVPRLQAQNPPARQALGAHGVLRLAVDHGALPVQRRRTRRTGRRGGACLLRRIEHRGSDAQRSLPPAPHRSPLLSLCRCTRRRSARTRCSAR
jgi:hypothetical protein